MIEEDNGLILPVIESNNTIYLRADIPKFLASLKGNIRETREHYVVECPSCKEEKLRTGNPGYDKKKLYILKDESVGRCARCGLVIIRQHIANINELVIKNAPNFKDPLTSRMELQHISPLFEGGIDFYFDKAEELQDDAIEFLKCRRSYSVIKNLDKLGFKSYKGDFVIPFPYMGEIIYYQINYRNPKGLKYFSPPIRRKPIYVPKYIGPKLILTEGVYDAIACMESYPDRTCIALLGSDVTDYQVWMIRRLLPKDIVVYMDDISISNKVVNRLRATPLSSFCKFSIVESHGMDADEFLKQYNKEYYA